MTPFLRIGDQPIRPQKQKSISWARPSLSQILGGKEVWDSYEYNYKGRIFSFRDCRLPTVKSSPDLR